MKRKPNRLDLANYRSLNIYYLTLNCFNRQAHFSDGGVVAACLEQLTRLKEKFNAQIWAYCFMPDHLHILIETENSQAFTKLFKQMTGYYFKQQTGKTLWQKSFYDHILRRDEDLVGATAYLLNNPVRAGLVKNYLDYHHAGSFEIAIEDFVESAGMAT